MPSDLLFDRYEILSKIGEGAQSIVHLVRDTHNQGVLKAAKILKEDYLKDHSLQILVQEFHLLESIDHENLVQVFECRFKEDSPETRVPIVITEYVPGSENLESYLKSGTLTTNDKIVLTFQIFDALRYLHRKKIIHGDLKPSNILVLRRPLGGEVGGETTLSSISTVQAKVIDFGVSHDLIASRLKKRVGTPYYLAPEIMREGIEPASDLYSVGVILYRLFIATKLPYQGREVNELLACHSSRVALFEEKDFATIPKTTPASIVELIRSLLATEIRERPRDIGRILSQLRFEFSDLLFAIEPSSNRDTRLRETIGSMKKRVAIAKEVIYEHCRPALSKREPEVEPKLLAARVPSRNVLIIGAPSGGGKTRYLLEVTKLCQSYGLEHHLFSFRQHNFWDALIRNVLERFGHVGVSRRMRNRLLQVMASPDPMPRTQIFSRYLHSLAHELNGLVLMIDGLSQYLSVEFVDILRAVARHANRGATLRGHLQGYEMIAESKLVLILTSETEAIEETDEKPGRKIGDYFDQLHRVVSEKSTSREGQTRPSGVNERKQWLSFSEPLRALGNDGISYLVKLDPWESKDVAYYLRASFPDETLGATFADELRERTHGNPGLLQALCSEAVGGAAVESTLRSLSESETTHDLQIYKLNRRYSSAEKSLLALLAAFESTTEEDLNRIWMRYAKNGAPQFVRQTLIRAFDDGFLQVETFHNGAEYRSYGISSQNLHRYLASVSLKALSKVGEILFTILNLGEEVLFPKQLLGLAAFMQQKDLWAKTLLKIFNETRHAPAHLALAPYHEALKKQPWTFDWQTQLNLKFMELELCYLRVDYRAVEQIAREILDEVVALNDPFSNAIRARTQLAYGTYLRVDARFVEAIEILRDAVDSELLSDTDHYYAAGSLALCELASVHSETDKEARDTQIELLAEARHQLREKDPVRYAILTGSFGGYFLDRKEFDRALPYLEIAAKTFAQHQEVGRQVLFQLRMGKTYFLAGRHQQALDLFQQTLPLAERHGLFIECLDLLTYVIRIRYTLGDFKKIAPAFLHLTHLCEQIGDMRPIAQVIQPAVDAFLENGRIDEAQGFLQKHLTDLERSGKAPTPIDRAIHQLLLAQIYQRKGEVDRAQSHYDAAHSAISQMNQSAVQTKRAEQTHLLGLLEMLEEEEGPREALAKLEGFFQQGKLGEFIVDDLYFQAFHLAAWAEEPEAIERYLPECQKRLEKIPAQKRVNFYVDWARSSLDNNDIQGATKALRAGARLLSVVVNPIIRANLHDQKARLAHRQGERAKARQYWQSADDELKQYLKHLAPKGIEHFQAHSPSWTEHRVIAVLLEAEAGGSPPLAN